MKRYDRLGIVITVIIMLFIIWKRVGQRYVNAITECPQYKTIEYRCYLDEKTGYGYTNMPCPKDISLSGLDVPK